MLNPDSLARRTPQVEHWGEDALADGEQRPGEADRDPTRTARDRPGRAAVLDSAAEARLAALYRAHVARVYRYVYSRVGNVQDAEDLTAQVFLGAVDALVAGKPPREPAAWLLTLARRRLADHFRRRRPSDPIEAADEVIPPTAEPLAGYLRDEEMRRLEDALAGLAESDLELLRLRFGASLGYREMSRVLGKAEGAVKMAVHRLVRRMARDWEADDDRNH